MCLNIDEHYLYFNEYKIKNSSYKHIFIIGENNSGKTKILKNLERFQVGKLIEISKLENEFQRSFESFSTEISNQEHKERGKWYEYTRNNYSKIAEVFNQNVEIMTDQEINEAIKNGSSEERAVDFFKINGNIFSSTGYISLFLLCSYLFFYNQEENKQPTLFLDEIDAFLDLKNKLDLAKIIDTMNLNIKLIVSTHSPYTMMKAKDYLIIDLNKNNLYYSNDIKTMGQLENILNPELKIKYCMNDKLLNLSKIYKRIILNKINFLTKDESDYIQSIKNDYLSFKESIILNAIEDITKKNNLWNH